ncbi:MAG: PD40 domain-containing protein [Bacteroidetes bacterium]|nr:PD40 domain-containing protein [Bacteroidota bacterium]
MVKWFFLFTVILTCRPIFAQDNPGWLRYCAISPDGRTIAFTHGGQLYTVPAGGGAARALTRDSSYHFMPVWSHDGTRIAFASSRWGNFDVFITRLDGGEPKRLTAHSADEYPYDFTADDSCVLFGAVRMDAPACRLYPSDALPELYKVPCGGGRVEQVLTTPAEDAHVSPSGRLLVYHDRKGRENPWRKHQTSSVARDIWMYDLVTSVHTKLSSFEGEDRDPVFAGNDTSIYYLSEGGWNRGKGGRRISEEVQSFNVYRMGLTGHSRPRQVTFFSKEPVRSLSVSRDGTLCFSYGGSIWCKRRNGDAVKVRIMIPDGPTDKGDVTIAIGDAEEMAVAPDGKEIAFIFRGEVFLSSAEGQRVRRITRTAGVESGVSFSPDGRRLLYGSERDGRWKIVEAEIDEGQRDRTVEGQEGLRDQPAKDQGLKDPLVKEKVLIGGEHENYQPRYSPDGSEIAYIEDRTTLKVYAINSGRSRTILKGQLYSRRDNDQYFRWSPDGKWLLLQYSEPGAGNDEVGILRADGKGSLINLTSSGFNESQPRWAMGGGMVVWLSDRDGLRSYAGSGMRQKDVYALCLSGEAWDVLHACDPAATATTVEIGSGGGTVTTGGTVGEARTAVGGETAVGGGTAVGGRTAVGGGTAVGGEPAVGGGTARRVRLTRVSRLLADALLSADGRKIYYVARSDKGYDLWETDLYTGASRLLAPVGSGDVSMETDRAGDRLFICAGGNIFRVDAATGESRPVYTKGEMTLSPAAERQSMFEHIWRRVNETFYDPDLHGVDWVGCKAIYERWLSDVDNNYDFAELLNEMLGELNVSHTGATYRPPATDGNVTASLGVFYSGSYRGTGMQVEEVIQDGPLDDPSLGIRRGTVIEAIDGITVSPDRDIAWYLNGKAGKDIELTIRNGEVVKKALVRPVTSAEEGELLYRRWVRRNRAETDSLSHGMLGYVHLPRMNDAAYRDVYEEVLGRYAGRKGIVVDTRFNRGGDLAPELTMFLSGRRIRDNAAGTFRVSSEPSFRWNRPSVVLAGEANYSDGSCLVYDYQYLHMGKLVGMPVPGSCTFQTGESLQDNSLRWSCPSLGVRDLQGRYLEGRETEPDVRVMNAFGEVGAGRDQQLEEAVRVLLRDIR